jgi:hypothetical protein
MINRLKKVSGEADETPPDNDYYEVKAEYDTYYVAQDVAEYIAAMLKRRWPPRWICFTDIFGATVRVRSRQIGGICESTNVQRRNEKKFRRARHREDKEGRNPWDDDDFCC